MTKHMDQGSPDVGLLLKRLNAANRSSKIFIGIAAAMAAVLLFAIDWAYLAQYWVYALVAVGLATASGFRGYAMLVAQKKTRACDLPEGARIGLYSKTEIIQTVNSVMARLDLMQTGTTVYLVRDKTANASAVNVGFSGLFRSLNAVYINRAILHILPPLELEAILGHEFAHNGPMRMAVRRYGTVFQIFIILVALYVLQRMDVHGYWSLPVVLGTIFPLQWSINFFEAKYSQTIEYLCDYFGAQLVGSAAMINALLKIGSQAEAHLRIQWRLLQQSQSEDRLSTKELLQIFEDALPFGEIDPDTVESQINDLKQSRLKEKQKLSIKGFLEYINDRPTEELEDTLDELDQTMRRLKRLPAIDWASRFQSAGTESLAPPQITDLVEALKDQPQAVLFRLPEEVSGANSSHPSFRNRILSIWDNRTVSA